MTTTLSAPLPTTGTTLRAGDTELPLESVRINAVVDGVGVVWTVVQTFVNTLDEAMEAIYTFPLPNEGAVNRATMHIGDRAIEAEMKERGEARVEYEEAVAKGQTAMLLDSMPVRSSRPRSATSTPARRSASRSSCTPLSSETVTMLRCVFPPS